MLLLLHLSEAAGMLVAASSVRMVAGTVAGLLSLFCMTAIKLVNGGPAPLMLPVAVLMLVLLRVNQKRLWIVLIALMVLLPVAVALLWTRNPREELSPDQIIFAIPSGIWLLLGLKEKSGAALVMTVPPFAILLADGMSARLLLIAAVTALAALLVRSYGLKRQIAKGW